MSRLVTPDHWQLWLGDMPMPEDATLEMMYAAYDAMTEFENKDEDFKMLAWHQESKEVYTKRREFWVKRTHEPDYAEKLETYDSILNLIDEGIQLLTERING